MPKLATVAIGLARPLPAISGALPWIGSYSAGWRPLASLAPSEARGQHADRAGELRGLVREDVAEQIVGHDHVELLGIAHQLHGAIVRQDVRELDIGKLRVVHALRRLRATARRSP